MSEQWIEFFPKRQLFGSFTQSTYEALDITGLNPRLIRVRAELLNSTDTVTVTVQEALTNEESAYVVSASAAVSLGNDPTGLLIPIGVQTLAVAARFIRLDISTTLGGTSISANVQAEILVSD